MTPVDTLATTTTLKAPPDWPTEKLGPCQELPIAEAHGHMFSYWRPSPEELVALIAGMPVRLGIRGSLRDGRGHPVVSLDVEV